jgi:hypothetical protein
MLVQSPKKRGTGRKLGRQFGSVDARSDTIGNSKTVK